MSKINTNQPILLPRFTERDGNIAQFDASFTAVLSPLTYNGLLALMREQHEAMAVIMQFRRQSNSPEQRAQAQQAIDVWRVVEKFLSTVEEKSQ